MRLREARRDLITKDSHVKKFGMYSKVRGKPI